jgi:hypothetical protein
MKQTATVTGIVARGETVLAPMRAMQPWPTGPFAEASRARGRRRRLEHARRRGGSIPTPWSSAAR